MKRIVEKFKISGECISCEKYGCGHINETYLVKTDTQKKYILQKINNKIFTNVPKLMENIVAVTSFLSKKIEARNSDPEKETLIIVPTATNEPFFEENGEYYRVYKFIEGSVTLQTAEKPEHFYQSARAFGRFQNDLSLFPAESLFEVIKDFHNTRKRFNDLMISVDNDFSKRKSTVKNEIEFAKSFESETGKIVDALKSGVIPMRVTHNDTKLNNVLLNEKTFEPMAVIDLDTVMPGSLLYDFGDSIRFGANTAPEDEKDLSKIKLDENLFDVYAKGFLSSCNSATDTERKMLPLSAFMMTYECGIRFLADYIDGDKYFRTQYPEHNLVRARDQFRLCEDIVRKYDILSGIVEKYR